MKKQVSKRPAALRAGKANPAQLHEVVRGKHILLVNAAGQYFERLKGRTRQVSPTNAFACFIEVHHKQGCDPQETDFSWNPELLDALLRIVLCQLKSGVHAMHKVNMDSLARFCSQRGITSQAFIPWAVATMRDSIECGNIVLDDIGGAKGVMRYAPKGGAK